MILYNEAGDNHEEIFEILIEKQIASGLNDNRKKLIANIKRNIQIVMFQPCVPKLGAWSCIKQVQPDSSLLTRYTTTVLCDTICNDNSMIVDLITMCCYFMY